MSWFITLEGIEGSGKSTQAALLAERLRREGHDPLLTREPGGTDIGRAIRRLILSPDHQRMCPETELGLYFSDRAQHLREIVWPALAAGKIVVSDRFTDSTLAYQGYGRGLPLKLIRSLDRLLTGGFRPDVTLLLDLPAEEGLSRARRRNRSQALFEIEGRFEREEIEFHERVRSAYRRMARRESNRYLVIPATGAPERIHDAVWERLSEKLSSPAPGR